MDLKGEIKAFSQITLLIQFDPRISLRYHMWHKFYITIAKTFVFKSHP